MPNILPGQARGAWLAGLALLATAAMPPAHAGQDPAPVQAVVSNYLQAQASVLPGMPEITVETGDTAQLADCAALSAFMPGSPRLRARMSVGVRCDAPTPWTIYVQAGIKVQGSYFVTAQAITAGTTVASGHLASRQGDLLSLPQGTVLQAEDAIGSVATRRIAAGQVLRTNALRSAQAVQRGRKVRLVINGSGFVATSEGHAMASAAPGAYVQVRTTSGQMVSGIVRDAGTVEIPL